MVRSGRSAGFTPAPWAAANPGFVSEETAAAAVAPRNPRRELVFDMHTSLPDIAIGNLHAVHGLRPLPFFHFICLRGLRRIVVAPQPRQRFGQIERTLRDGVHAFAEAKMKIVAF